MLLPAGVVGKLRVSCYSRTSVGLWVTVDSPPWGRSPGRTDPQRPVKFWGGSPCTPMTPAVTQLGWGGVLSTGDMSGWPWVSCAPTKAPPWTGPGSSPKLLNVSPQTGSTGTMMSQRRHQNPRKKGRRAWSRYPGQGARAKLPTTSGAFWIWEASWREWLADESCSLKVSASLCATSAL